MNVLFLGETNIGESSIIDLVAGPREQKTTPLHSARRALGYDARSVTLDGKIFKLHASPASESMTPVALRKGIQNTLMNLRRNGGIHLLVYCVNALHSILWIHEIHRTIASTGNSTASPLIPAVVAVAGMSDVDRQESWWSRNEGALANQGLWHFDDHAFIPMMTTGAQSPTGDQISESRHVLHTLILQNCAHVISSETDSDFQRTALYKQRSIANSFQSFFALSAGKPSSHTSASSKAIDIVLLGEIGVGKSSLVNLITGEKVAEISSDTIGCTKTTAEYTFEEKGRTFRLHDTPGLVDPQMGIEPFVDPIDIIQKLIRRLGNGNGPDLLLFCTNNSKPTAALRRNYRLFCKIICKGEVPFALATTNLEECQSADQWWSQHKATIRSYGIDCSGHVGIGHAKNHLDPSLDSLRESLLSSFVTFVDRHWQKQRTSSLLFESMERLFGSIPSLLRSQVSTVERTLMNQCDLEEQTARELANRMVGATLQ